MAESLYQGVGGLSFPVVAADVETTLAPLDPARNILAALFTVAINAELGAVWTKVTATLGAGHPLIGTDPVADTLQLEPSPLVMKERKATWPLLCVHRTGRATFDPVTMSDDKLTQDWAVHYILGPLSTGDLFKLHDICSAVPKVIRLVCRKRGHPAYQSGALQFFPDVGGLGSVEVTGYEGPGQSRFAGDDDSPLYYSVTVTLSTTETTTDDVDAFGNAEAVDFIAAAGDDQGILPSFVIASTDGQNG